MAGAILGEVEASLFVAGAAFGEVQASLFVAGVKLKWHFSWQGRYLVKLRCHFYSFWGAYNFHL